MTKPLVSTSSVRPAVVGFNVYNRRVRALTSQIDVVAQVILAALRAEQVSHTPESGRSATVEKPSKADKGSGADKTEEKK